MCIRDRARVNCISHLLDLVDYEEVDHPVIELPDRKLEENVDRPPKSNYNYVPDVMKK